MDSGSFNISCTQNGSFYGLVLLHGSVAPSAVQIRNQLNSTNFLVPNTSWFNVSFLYPGNINPNDVNYTISSIANFTKLMDNTLYDAYFVAENSYPLFPDLLPTYDVQVVTFLTQSELYSISPDYDFAPNMQASLILLIFTTIFLIFMN